MSSSKTPNWGQKNPLEVYYINPSNICKKFVRVRWWLWWGVGWIKNSDRLFCNFHASPADTSDILGHGLVFWDAKSIWFHKPVLVIRLLHSCVS